MSLPATPVINATTTKHCVLMGYGAEMDIQRQEAQKPFPSDGTSELAVSFPGLFFIWLRFAASTQWKIQWIAFRPVRAMSSLLNPNLTAPDRLMEETYTIRQLETQRGGESTDCGRRNTGYSLQTTGSMFFFAAISRDHIDASKFDNFVTAFERHRTNEIPFVTKW